jgi:hypothetical protein
MLRKSSYWKQISPLSPSDVTDVTLHDTQKKIIKRSACEKKSFIHVHVHVSACVYEQKNAH